MTKNKNQIFWTILLIIGVGAILFVIYFGSLGFTNIELLLKDKKETASQEEKEEKNINNKNSNIMSSKINLPEPNKQSSTSLEEAIANRRSERSYSSEGLPLSVISQLVWAAQGVTGPDEQKRAAPSAGALYPLEVYVVVGDLSDLDPGVYHYLPLSHELELVSEGRLMEDLARVALGQMFIAEAPVNIVITGDYSVTAQKYGDRARQYVHLEAGHVAENLFLQAVSLDLNTVTVGAFQEKDLKELLNIPEDETPLYIMPVGKKEQSVSR